LRPVGEPAGAAGAAPGEPTEERATSSANASALSSRARSADASAALSSTTPVGVSVFPAEPPELAQQRHSRLLPAFRDAPLHSARAPRARLTAGSVAAHADGAPSATMVVFALRERCALTAPSVLGALFVPLAARCATAARLTVLSLAHQGIGSIVNGGRCFENGAGETFFALKGLRHNPTGFQYRARMFVYSDTL